MGRKKKAKHVGSQLRVRTTAQLERELKDTLADPDPAEPFDMSNAQEWCSSQPSPPHYINGKPYNEKEKEKMDELMKQKAIKKK
jgi:hypothetical protein